MAEDERALLENLPDLVPPGVVAPRLHRRTRFLQGDETLELAGHRVRDAAGPRPLARRTSPTTPTAASSPATCSSPARSAAPTSRAPTGRRSSSRSACSASASRPRPIVYSGPRPADDARRRARAQPVPRSAARLVTTFEAPRGTHDILPSEQPLWRLVTGEAERLCSLYGYRPIQTPVLRGHGALPAHSGAGLGRRAEGDVHVRGPRRPLADAAPGGHGADRARVPRARPAPRGAAGQALHDRDDVPLRGAAARALPRALAALGRGDRLRRPGDRRRDDPALRRAARAPRRHATTSCC